LEPRELTEELEEMSLSPHAMRSRDSRGRGRPEALCPVRTCYQRDRDRIIHSKAFRRLKHKTQVFVIPEGDHFRTRLTHTLEVSQIARTIARALRLNEDLTEAIALGHDLGHTPFGHGGEEALREVLAQVDPPRTFDHNVQSLRVVDVLERGEGLNLTWEVRDGILNHTGDLEPGTLEGKVVKISDRVAYINHDIDDALRGGILHEEDLPRDCIEVLGSRHSDRIDTMVRDVISSSQGRDCVCMSPAVGEATRRLREYLFRTVYVGSAAKREEDKAKRLLKRLYWFYRENPGLLPEGSDSDLDNAVTDYVAGMTDRFAVAQYQRHFLPGSWRLEE